MSRSSLWWRWSRALCLAVVLSSLGTALGCEQKPAKTLPDDATPVETKADKGTAGGPDGVGQRCEKIEECNSYLSCIDGTCQIPPAVTGEHDAQTPVVRFVDQGGQEIASFYVELAITPAEQSKGLMFRREMKDDWGMLFIYPDEAPRSFWMQNTFISLDMVFVDGAGRIANIIEGAQPLTRVPRQSKGAVRYVLELNTGRAAEVGLEPGDQMELEGVDLTHMPSQ